jgi:hypothetical protein
VDPDHEVLGILLIHYDAPLTGLDVYDPDAVSWHIHYHYSEIGKRVNKNL